MTKKELIEAMKDYPDDAKIDIELPYWDMFRSPGVEEVKGFDERFGYITLVAR